MITKDGYCIAQFTKQNQILIQLPQTAKTFNSSIGGISNRKLELSGQELTTLLDIVMRMYEVEE